MQHCTFSIASVTILICKTSHANLRLSAVTHCHAWMSSTIKRYVISECTVHCVFRADQSRHTPTHTALIIAIVFSKQQLHSVNLNTHCTSTLLIYTFSRA